MYVIFPEVVRLGRQLDEVDDIPVGRCPRHQCVPIATLKGIQDRHSENGQLILARDVFQMFRDPEYYRYNKSRKVWVSLLLL